jgi:methyl-accepting chemotaxis protein PixJ
MTTKTLNQNLSPSNQVSGLSKLNLKTKATILAIAIGVLPVLIVGAVAYTLVDLALEKIVRDNAELESKDFIEKIDRFVFERYGDIQALANLPILRNERVKKVTTLPQRQQVLVNFASVYGVYESISFMDLNGDDQLVTGNAKLTNHKDDDYFKAALTTGKPFISQPRFNKGANQVVVFFSAPVKDSESGQVIGVVRTRMPIKYLDAVVKDQFTNRDSTYHFADKAGKIFVSNDAEAIANPEITKHFPEFPSYRAGKKTLLAEFYEPAEKRDVLAAYSPWASKLQLPNLEWDVVIARDSDNAFKTQVDLGRLFVIGVILAAIATTSIAIWLAGKATKPIEEAAEAVEQIGKGQLNTRLDVSGSDEIAVLGSNINLMTQQLEQLLKDQELELGRIEVARQEARADADASAQEQKTAKEKLQSRALELLMEVDPISRGDLTIRAQVTDDEIGTLADSYNSTVQSLRQIVLEVQTTAQQVNDTTSLNQPLAQSLSQEALRQVEEVAIALERIQEMSRSIRTVADNAQQAENLMQQTSTTLHEGDIAMNRTVDGIRSIRDTVSETSEKVKRLGEASQNISRAVKLISSFAEQTNLLALNASIEAARAGVQGRGFAVVADEIQSLAQQSTEASAEITDLVAEIQSGTGEVVLAMAAGTTQVDIGTKLVEEARLNLTQISASSQEISSLVEAIALATVEQSKSSDVVSETINDVAAIAMKTSTDSDRVSTAFKNLLEIAQKLQKSAGRFKV